MDMMKISLIGIAGALLAIQFRTEKPVFGILISLAAGICIFSFLLTRLDTVVSYVNSLKAALPVDGYYFEIIMKMIGITYLAEFASGLCKDAGYAEIASQIEMFAKISILMVSMPVFVTFLEAIGDFL